MSLAIALHLDESASRVRDANVDLLAAAVRDMDCAILLAHRAADGWRTLYANEAMQGLTANLLGERSQVQLQAIPDLGDALSLLLDESGSPGRHDRELELMTRQGARVLRAQVRPGPEPGLRIVRLDAPSEPTVSESEPTRAIRRCASAGGIGHWEWDLLGGSAWYDALTARLLNLPARDLGASVKALHARIHDDDRAPFLNAMRRHLEQRQPFDIEVRARDVSPARWLRLRGEAGRDSAGLPVRMSGTLEDVTDRCRQLDEIRSGQAVLRSTFDTLVGGVGVLDANGEIIELNKTWVEWPSASGLMGLRFSFGENYVALCRSSTDRCNSGNAAADGVERVLDGSVGDFVLDYRAADLDGSERALQMRVRPFTTPAGRGAIVTHTDSTSVDLAMRALKENDTFYRMVLSSVPLYISYVNDSSEIVFVNRVGEEWLGQPLDVLRGRRLEELTDVENYQILKPRVDAVLSGRRVDFDTQIVRDGAVCDVAVSYVPNVVAGSVIGFFSVARDVTQEKRLETELLQAQKMEAMGRLTGGVAHDFNNLLSVIIGNLQLLDRELGPACQHRARLVTAIGAANRGADLTRRLLSFSRRKTVDPRPIDVNAVVAGLEELLAPTIGKNIEFAISLAAGIWPICLDAGELENALLNLAINACDAMPDGGSLTLTTRNLCALSVDAASTAAVRPGDYVEITVTDTGCGMPASVVSKAFEPFFTTKEPGKGTGLGLSIVYGLAVRAGGTAIIDSRPSAGTTVRLLFPRHVPQATPASGGSKANTDRAGDATVLILDVRSATQTELDHSLASLGYAVSRATSVAEVLAAATCAQPPDLVLIVDLQGGELDPAALNDRLRILNPAIRVVLPTLAGTTSTGPALPPRDSDLVSVVRIALAKEFATHV